MASVVLVLAIESPTIGLEKILLHARKPKTEATGSVEDVKTGPQSIDGVEERKTEVTASLEDVNRDSQSIDGVEEKSNAVV